jgi:predicted Zn finger-like uncharacterized protein
MATTLTCPSCSRTLRVPDALLGKAVRCPGCLTTFAGPPAPDAAPQPPPEPAAAAPAPEPAAPPAPTAVAPLPNLTLGEGPPAVAETVAVSPVPPPTAPASSPPPGAAGAATRPCPYCGERIGRDDERCRFCGEQVADEDERPWERRRGPAVRRDCEPHRGQLVLIFGIISLVMLACYPVAIIGIPFGIIAWVLGNKDLEKMRLGTMDPEGQGLTQAGRVCGIVGTIIDGLLVLACGAYFALMFTLSSMH